MKKISILLFIVMLFSCKDELNITPTTFVETDVAFAHVDLMVKGAYSLIGSAPGAGAQEGALYSTDLLLNADLLASENYMQWRGTFNQYNEISNKAMSTTNTSVTRVWRKGYAAINLANTILENLGSADPADQDNFKGNALFIRGIVEFELLRFWMEPSTGLGIPLLTQSTQTYEDVKLPARATIADTYAAIIADLKEAQTLLPDDDDVYATKTKATAFLARVYLQQGDYANALASANTVIGSNKYSLPSSVEQSFNTSGAAENIFEIQQTTVNNAGTANDGLATFYACNPKTPGSTGRGDVQVDSLFILQYEATDKRRNLLIYAGTCNKASNTSGKWFDPYSNIPVIRLSEIYLIRAETNIRQGSSVGDTPLNDVNAIRTKAGATLLGSVALSDVLLERELELAFEGQRIHDFKRTAKVANGADYTEPEFIFPIPQTEINTNSNLQQNTFYQ